MLAGGEVVFGGVDEGNPEVEEQVDDQRPGVLRQEDLHARQEGRGQSPGVVTNHVDASPVFTYRDPADLGPQVPEVEGGCGADGEMLQNILVLQRLAL